MKVSLRVLLLLVASALSGCRGGTLTRVSVADGQAGIPAFPGAQGAGSTTPGGRGGRVIFVTNLNDSGPGSLRAACEAEGTRVVVFRVAGVITLSTPIVVKNPYLTVAAQTAPGDGVCLRSAAFVIATHDVIVRHLRSRLGDLDGRAEDCITVAGGARNVILDHCSVSWSVDEALSLDGDVADVTVQWCIIAEALNRSRHDEGEHGFGSLVRASGRVSLHHNLWAHNKSRNPRLGDNSGRPPYPSFDVRNNVIYDYGNVCMGITQGVLRANYVGNFIRPGPRSTAAHPIRVGPPSDMLFYVGGNVFEGSDDMTADNSLLIDSFTFAGQTLVRLVEEPFPGPRVQTDSAADAYEAVLASAGATLPTRDAVDARIVEDVRQRTGQIIDTQEQVGGWPVYRAAEPVADADEDGMPDAWERVRGLDPHDAADSSLDRDGDGYTNVEEYVNGLAARG